MPVPGQSEGSNSQFNGDGFYKQKIDVQILAEEDWQSWMDEAKSAPVLNADNYQTLAEPSTPDEAEKALGLSDTRMALGDADLFQKVVMRYHQGTEISAAQQPGTEAYKDVMQGDTQEGTSQ